MTPQELSPLTLEIRQLLETQLRVRGASLEKQVHRAGRLLPRKIRAEAAVIVQANLLVQNPKLSRIVSADRVGQAHLAVSSYLQAIDPKERAKTRALNYAGFIAFNALLLSGIIITILVWRGIV